MLSTPRRRRSPSVRARQPAVAVRFYAQPLACPVTLARDPDRLRFVVGGELTGIFTVAGRPIQAVVQGRRFRGNLMGRFLDVWRPGATSSSGAAGRAAVRAARQAAGQRLFRTLLLLHQTLADQALSDLVVDGALADPLAAASQWLLRTIRYHAEQPEKDAEEFHRFYPALTLVPPDQHMAAVLYVTDPEPGAAVLAGRPACRPGRARTLPEFLQHIQELKRVLGPHLARKRSILLAGDLLHVRQPLLVRMLDAVNAAFDVREPPCDRDGREYYPPPVPNRFHGIYALVNAFANVHKRTGDFRELARRKLRRLYLDVESGHEELLAAQGRPAAGADILHAALAAREGGLRLGVIVTLGLGGRRFSREHVRRTAVLLRLMHLGPPDVLLFRVPVDPADPLSDQELCAQREALLQALRKAGQSGPGVVATYTADRFFY